MAAARRGRTLLIATAVTTAVVAAGAGGASVYGAGQIEARLARIGAAAGLQVSHDDVRVSPLGEASVHKLRFARPDGSAVLAVAEVSGTLAPLDALRGRRRPDAVAVRGLRLDVHVVDGKPTELLRLARAARAALGSGKRQARPKSPAPSKRGTAISLQDGVVTVRVTGRGAAFLPGGLKLSDLRVDIDTARGRGAVSAQVSGAATSTLSAKLRPAVGERPARVEARFAPALRLPIPKTVLRPLAGLADAVEVAGLGYDAVDGPRLEVVRLLRGSTPVVTVERVGLSDEGGSVVAGPVAVALPHAALQRSPALRALRPLLAKVAPANAGTPTGAGATPGAAKGRAAKPPTAPPQAAVWRATAGSVTLSAASLAAATAGNPRTAKRSAADDPAPKQPGSGPPAPAGAGSTEAKEPAAGSGTQLTLTRLSLRPPSGPVRATLAAVVVDLDPSLAGLAKLTRVAVTDPVLHVQWRRSDLARVPLGAQIYRLVERLRGHHTSAVGAAGDAEGGAAGAAASAKGDPANAKARQVSRGGKKGTKASKRRAKRARKRRRKRGRRVPATRAAIAPLRALHRSAVRVDDRVNAAMLRLAKLAAVVVVTGARVDLVAPAAAQPFAGLRAGRLSLGRRTADGSRTLSASVEPFIGEEQGGPVLVDLRTAPGGRLARLSLKLGGALWAKGLATLGNAASTKADATVALDVALTAAQHNHPELRGTLQVAHVGVNWWRIAPRPIDDFSFSGTFALTASPDDHSLRLHIDPLDLGGAKLRFELEALDLAKRPTVHLRLHSPKQDCAKVAAAIPPSLTPIIGTITAEGEIGGTFDLTLPLDNPYKGKLKAHLDDETCVVSQFGGLEVEALGGAFKRPVNESGTVLEDQLIGPRSDAWVPLKELPPWVPYAMIATEDAAFYHHRGVRVGLTSRAIKMCLDYGRFVYGGSTITQQLVKNLFLTRDKNLARKFEELLIVWHMERALYSKERLDKAEDDERPIKDRILELYVNGIEFAPHLYGIQRGAKLYFDKDARKLTPLETAFLAANKPCPKCGHKRFETQKWTAWWQERMVNIMNKMRTEGIITEAQFTAEAPYVPRFVGWPQAEKPSPAAGGSVGGVGGDEE